MASWIELSLVGMAGLLIGMLGTLATVGGRERFRPAAVRPAAVLLAALLATVEIIGVVTAALPWPSAAAVLVAGAGTGAVIAVGRFRLGLKRGRLGADDTTRRQNIRLYFEGSRLQWAFLPTGVLLSIIPHGAYVGLPIILIGVGWLAVRHTERPDDATMDARLEEDIQSLVPRAVARLNIFGGEGSVADPLVIRGLPDLGADDKATGLRWKKGSDSRWRTSVNRILIFFPHEDKLSVYRCDYDFISGAVRHEREERFYYADIISVRTREVPTAYALTRGKQTMFAQLFEVIVPSGDRIDAVVGLLGVVKGTRVQMVDTGADLTIRNLRRQIQEKKPR